MKRIIYFLILLLIVPTLIKAQGKINFAGLGVSYLIPTGSLTSRFKPAGGFNLLYGYSANEKWEWSGNFEFINFNKENRDRLKIKRNINLGGNEITKTFDLPKLQTDLKIYGLSGNASSKIFDYGFLNCRLNFGFGIYRWESFRSEYFDTLKVDTMGTTYDAVILKVPALKQLDWSGGFNLGLNLSTKIIEPIWFELNANYKAVIGELWATLDLDLENISVFQMYELKITLKAKF